MKKIYKILSIAGLICLASGTVLTTVSLVLEPGFREGIHEIREEFADVGDSGEALAYRL